MYHLEHLLQLFHKVFRTLSSARTSEAWEFICKKSQILDVVSLFCGARLCFTTLFVKM